MYYTIEYEKANCRGTIQGFRHRLSFWLDYFRKSHIFMDEPVTKWRIIRTHDNVVIAEWQRK